MCVWEKSIHRSYACYTCDKSFEVSLSSVFKENLNASRPSEHPSVKGKKIKNAKRLSGVIGTMTFKRVPPW